MSRIGKLPIPLPDSVAFDAKDRLITIKGPKGELTYRHNPGVMVKQAEGRLQVTRESDTKELRALHGLTRALVANMVHGVEQGFTRQLDLIGVGYTVEQKGANVLLNLGYSHAIYFQAPPGIEFEVLGRNTSLLIKGIDKQAVGQVAAKIRSLRKPEPYKGKGVRYSDEHVRRKAGKTVDSGAGAV